MHPDFGELHQRFIELSSPMEPVPTSTEPMLPRQNGIKAVVFDFYGTLFLSGVGDIGIDDGASDEDLILNTLHDSNLHIRQENAGSRAFELYEEVIHHEMEKLRSAGIETPEPDIRKVWGNILKILEDEKLLDGPVSNEHQNRMAVEFEMRMNPVWPAPGAVDLLQYLKEKSFAMGIISNSQFYTPIVLEALTGSSIKELGFSENLLHWSFEERMKKPDLQFYERFLEKTREREQEIRPEEILYAGNDMLKDIWPAAKLGMRTALFAGDRRSLKWRKDDPRCRNLHPDVIFTEFSQLTSVIS